FAAARFLSGADSATAALEMTIAGPTLAVRAATIVGLAGADLGGIVRETGRRLLPGRSHWLAAGSTIACPGGDPGAGARASLALPGGIDVPAVLGSRATLLSAGFGGIDGRPARAGDLLAGAAAVDSALPPPWERAWPWLDGDPCASAGEPLRVVAGPGPGVEEIVVRAWRVGPDSDRIGLRLEAAGDAANATGGGGGPGDGHRRRGDRGRWRGGDGGRLRRAPEPRRRARRDPAAAGRHAARPARRPPDDR